MKKSILILTVVSLPVFSKPFSLLSGSEVDTKGQSYSYLGLTGEKALNRKFSILGKVWGDYLVYKFEQNNTQIKAEAPALQISGGIKRKFEFWSLSLWAGWERRDTSVRPEVQGVEVKGVKDSLLLQLEVFGSVKGNFYTSLITSFSSATSYLWSRARIKKSFLREKLKAGVEVIGQGNKDYRAVQSGVIMEVLLGRLVLTLRGGYKNSSNGNSPYTGIEVYAGF